MKNLSFKLLLILLAVRTLTVSSQQNPQNDFRVGIYYPNYHILKDTLTGDTNVDFNCHNRVAISSALLPTGEPTSPMNQLKLDGFNLDNLYYPCDWSYGEDHVRSVIRMAKANDMKLCLSNQSWFVPLISSHDEICDEEDLNGTIHPGHVGCNCRLPAGVLLNGLGLPGCEGYIDGVNIYNNDVSGIYGFDNREYETNASYSAPSFLTNNINDPFDNEDCKARANYDLLSLIYKDPDLKDIIWGHLMAGEMSQRHMFTTDGFMADRATTELPVSNLDDALGYFRANIVDGNQKLLTDLVNHSNSINANTEDVQFYAPLGWGNWCFENVPTDIDPQKYLTLTNRPDVIIEGSYYSAPNGPDWVKYRYDNIGHAGTACVSNFDASSNAHYLAQMKNCDFARSQGYRHVLATINTQLTTDTLVDSCTVHEGVYDYTPINSSSVDNISVFNANYLWFLAYTNIIHGAEGVVVYAFSCNTPPDYVSPPGFPCQRLYHQTSQPNQLASCYPGNNFLDRYTLDHFPQFYKDFTRYLGRELGYLTNKNLLSTEPWTVVASKTDAPDQNCIVPPADVANSYIVNGIAAAEALSPALTALFTGSSSNIDDYNDKVSENYGLRYTIRTNGSEAIMIISNPLNLPVEVELNFNSVTNPIISNSTAIAALFETDFPELSVVTDLAYKTNRNSNTDPNNVVQNPTESPLKAYASNSDKRVSLAFGPMDVHVIRFITANVPAVNNCWNKVWTNHGNGTIGGWKFRAGDRYIPGNFIDVNNDRVDEILCVNNNPNDNWVNLVNWSAGDWQWRWSNNGNNYINTNLQGWAISPDDKFLPFDYDGNGIDELLCIQAAHHGLAALYSFDIVTNDWIELWTNTQSAGWFDCSAPKVWEIDADDIFRVGDFDGDGIDELLCIQNHGTHPYAECKFLNYDPRMGCQWDVRWFNKGYGNGLDNISVWPIREDDRYIAGDYDGDNIDELLCIQDYNVGGKAKVLNFDNLGTNCSVQYTNVNSPGAIAGWGNPILSDDKILAGQIDNLDTHHELMFIQRNGGGWATTIDYKTIGDFRWNWSNQNQPFNSSTDFPSWYINDWLVADHTRVNGDYMLVQCQPGPDPKYLLAIGDYGCNSFIASMYSADVNYCNGNTPPNYRMVQENKDAQENLIMLNPNPSEGAFQASLLVNRIQDLRIQLVGLHGEVILEKSYQGVNEGPHTFNFDLSSFPPGIYVLKVWGDNFSSTKRINIVR